MAGVQEFRLPPFPKGWFVICLSEELQAGQVLSRHFGGEEVVIYRTENGKAVVMDAYCPHLGAHFGHGGTVEGELLVCPFHHFCFDPSGKCVKTGYGTKAPPKAVVRSWPVNEIHGMVLAYSDVEGGAPEWGIPEVDFSGWSTPRFQEWRLESNPQEIAENGVDIGHFRAVHGYDEVKEIKGIETDGPLLTAKYGMSRVTPFMGGGKKVHVEFAVRQWGLGYALVHAHALEYGLHSRHFVCPTPIDGKDIFLRIGVSVQKSSFQPGKIHPLLKILPKGLLFPFVLNGYFKGYTKDVSDDFKIWKNKKYVHPPMLAQGDGPVIPYRKWTVQFYPKEYIPAKRSRGNIETTTNV